MEPSRSWIAVACAEHVRRGMALGIMQVGHGQAAPLRRLASGDRVVYYAPSESFGGRDRLQSFVALAIVSSGPVYQVDMGDGFRPFRRAVRYLDTRAAPIRPLLDRPGFALSGASWGARLRFGLLRIDAASMDMIADAMGARESQAAA
jgi:hypothetical protein